MFGKSSRPFLREPFSQPPAFGCWRWRSPRRVRRHCEWVWMSETSSGNEGKFWRWRVQMIFKEVVDTYFIMLAILQCSALYHRSERLSVVKVDLPVCEVKERCRMRRVWGYLGTTLNIEERKIAVTTESPSSSLGFLECVRGSKWANRRKSLWVPRNQGTPAYHSFRFPSVVSKPRPNIKEQNGHL